MPGPVITPGLGAVRRSTWRIRGTGLSVCQASTSEAAAGESSPGRRWVGLAMRRIVQPNGDNEWMRIQFTKMQGAGNDFVVLDETKGRLGLTPAHYRFLGDRHFGVGADQILTVRPSVRWR